MQHPLGLRINGDFAGPHGNDQIPAGHQIAQPRRPAWQRRRRALPGIEFEADDPSVVKRHVVSIAQSHAASRRRAPQADSPSFGSRTEAQSAALPPADDDHRLVGDGRHVLGRRRRFEIVAAALPARLAGRQIEAMDVTPNVPEDRRGSHGESPAN